MAVCQSRVDAAEQAETQTVADLSTEHSAGSPEFFRRVARLGVQAAEALEHARQMGVVHRDIKPSNLMLDTSGHLWVTDFGLAMTQAGGNLAMTGDLLGTLRYMSPEQAFGQYAVLDHRTDIYSLGITLYEILTLRPAFGGNDRQKLLRDVAEREPRRPRLKNDAVPKDLETIVLKATTKERDGRYGSAQEVADDLVRFLENKPIQARRSGQAERLWRWSKRNPVVAGLTATAAVLLVLVAIVASVGYLRTSTLLTEVEQERDTAHEAQGAERKARIDEAAQRESALRYLGDLYASHIVTAQEVLESGHTVKLLELLNEHQPAEGRPDLRGWEWHYLNSNWPLDMFSVRAHPGYAISSVAWSPDSKLLPTAGQDGTIKLWDRDTREHIRTFEGHTAAISEIAWQRDGNRLASASGERTVKLWDVATGEVIHNLDHPGAVSISWSPDGEQLASAGRLGAIKIWDANSGQQVRTIRESGGGPAVAWSPDGSRLAAVGDDHVIKLYATADGRELAKLTGHTAEVNSLAWNPKGDRIPSATDCRLD